MNWKSAATWRRGLLALLVVGALVWFVGWGLPEVCSHQLPTGSANPVDVCGDMSATDPRALLFLLVVGGLLLPELAELEVAGVVTVRRAYKEVAGDGDGEFDESEERGAYAAVAFEAGFFGLTRYLLDGMTPAVVAGYLFNGDDELELDLMTTSGDVSTELEEAQLAAQPPRTSGVFYEDSFGCPLVRRAWAGPMRRTPLAQL